jgi:hypothetical protein
MALRFRVSAALLKGATMVMLGIWVVGVTVWHSMHGTLPGALTMSAVGLGTLIANAASFGLLWAAHDRFEAKPAESRSAGRRV